MNQQLLIDENPRFEREYGILELIRRLRTDQLSVYTSSTFDRGLIHQRFLFLDSVFLNRPDYIEHVLLTNSRNYAKSQFTRRVLGPLVGNGLLTSEGDFWRRQRRIAAPAFHHKRIEGFVAAMATATSAMLEQWRTRQGAFDVASDMMALTLEIIARTMFSTEVHDAAARVRDLMGIIMRFARPSVLDLFGLPEWLPRRYPRPFVTAVRELDALVAALIGPRPADAADRGDLLAMLVAARDPDTGEGMSDSQLRDEIMTIFLAGHETTANALAWTWYLLAAHPETEAKLQAELDRALDGRSPSFADLPELKYTRMVFEEAMRLYPPAHTLSRTALGEDRLGNFTVPAGAVITISPYVTHRNPRLWSDPERFDPERFLPEPTAARPRFAYLPFGGGPRICIGNGFALAEAQVIIAMVASRFRLRLASGHNVVPIGQATLRPKGGIWMTLEPR